MLAHVDDGVRAELVLQPAVDGEVVVGGREVGIVVDRDRVLPEAAGRLDEDDDVAGLQGGGDDLAVGRRVAVSTNSSPGAAPQAAVTASVSSAGRSASQRR